MNDVLTRAAALENLVGRETPDSPADALAEAVITCCNDLIEAGEPRMAVSLAGNSARLVPRTNRSWALRLGIVQARALRMAGDYEDALTLVQSISREMAVDISPRSDEEYELRICEAGTLWQLNRVNDAVVRLDGIRRELLTKPDSALLAACALQLSSAEMMRGNFAPARNFALEAVVSARRCGARFIEAMALGNIGQLERSRCRWFTAEDATQGALDIFLEDGNRIQVSHHKRSLAILAWKRGALERAITLTNESLVEASGLEHGLLIWYAHLLKGMVLLHLGEFAVAEGLFRAQANWEIPSSNSRPSLLTTEFLGDIHLEQGQAEAALQRYDEVWPKALALVPKGDIVAELRRRRAECYLLLGRIEQAYDEAKTGLEHCRELGDRYEEAATYRVLALAAAALGRAHEAKQHFTQGFAYYDDIETPYEWGKLWMSYGDWLRGPHAAEFADPRGALEAYQAARDHFERMGAKAKLAEVTGRIAEHGATLEPDRSASPRRHAARKPRLSADLERRAAWARDTFGTVTRHPHLLSLLEDVAKLSKSDAAILVLGESGTGKELVADGIHRLSALRGAYMPLNCSALPREVIENELFGHVSGGFTGALRDKPGLFEVCDGGTIFLDEIAEMSLDLQSKLLRFLESGEVRRIGASKNLRVDTRVVAATNRDRATLENGEGLRKDLYYRLAQAVIELPALRHRGEDVGLLIDHFLEESCAQEQKRVSLSDAAWERLVAYPWPGNVRQLKAAMRRLVLLMPEGHSIAAGELKLDDTSIPTSLLEEQEQSEKRKVIEALAQTRGSRTEAARMLGIPRTTLLNKIKRYGLT